MEKANHTGPIVALGEALVEFMPPIGQTMRDANHWEKFAGGGPATYAAAVARFGRPSALMTLVETPVAVEQVGFPFAGKTHQVPGQRGRTPVGQQAACNCHPATVTDINTARDPVKQMAVADRYPLATDQFQQRCAGGLPGF